MAQDTQTLATLIGSRICHDLISPVGAIQNGIELLTMEGQSGPEMALIADSVANATARIRFLRVAFGTAGGGQVIGVGEIRSILADMSQAGRVQFHWTGEEDCPRAGLQMLFLAMMCLESAMPRGGVVATLREAEGWAIRAPADRTRPDPHLWTQLCGGDGPAEVQPAHVQFPLLAALLQARGRQAELTEEEEAVVIRLPG